MNHEFQLCSFIFDFQGPQADAKKDVIGSILWVVVWYVASIIFFHNASLFKTAPNPFAKDDPVVVQGPHFFYGEEELVPFD